MMHGPPQGMRGHPQGMHGGPMNFGHPGAHSEMRGPFMSNRNPYAQNQMKRNGRAIQMHSSGPFEMRHMPPSHEEAMPVMMHLMHDLAGVHENNQQGAPVVIEGSPFGRRGMFGPHHPHF